MNTYLDGDKFWQEPVITENREKGKPKNGKKESMDELMLGYLKENRGTKTEKKTEKKSST